MREKRQVMVCGKSIYMAGMIMSLREDPGFEVIETAHPAEAAAVLQNRRPAAVVFDRNEIEQEQIAVLAKDHPGLPIIALNAEDNAAVVYSCRKQRARTLHDLCGIILGSSGDEEMEESKEGS